MIEPEPVDEPPATRPIGRPPAVLDEGQRVEFLGRLAKGSGIDQALRRMGLTYRAYENAIREDPGFRAEVASALRAGTQVLDEMGYHLAFRNIDIWFALTRRRDKANRLNEARADRARERAEDRADALRWERIERRDRARYRRQRRIWAELATLGPGIERDLYLHLVALREAPWRKAGEGPVEIPFLDRFTPEELAEWREAVESLVREIDTNVWSGLPQ